MVNNSLKRILMDIVDIKKDPIENAYLSFDEDNIYEIFILIIGCDNCPYEGGFYMFKINFSDRYPAEPPKVKFLTTIDRIRVNPNLYDNGKVCLSILGTWSGPEWTSVMSLRSLILSLQSLLCEHPLRNEPGYQQEDEMSRRNISYNRIVNYFNWYHAIINMVNNPVCPGFKDDIHRIYIQNYEKYVKLLDERRTFEASMIKCMYGMKMFVDYGSLVLPKPSEIISPKNI